MTAEIPTIDKELLVDKSHLEAIARVIHIADSTGQPQNIGIWGAVGTGKTSLARQIGALRGAPTFVINAGTIGTASAWYCEPVDLRHGIVPPRPSRFVEAIETPNSVVVLDDVMLDAPATAAILPVLDPTTRSTHVGRLNRAVTVASAVVIVATWQPLAGSAQRLPFCGQFFSRMGAGAVFELRQR